MAPDDPNADLRHLWQHQDRREPRMSLDQVRTRAQTLELKVHRRNLAEYAGGVVMLIIAAVVWIRGGAVMWSGANLLSSIGLVLLLLAGVYILNQLRTRGSARAMPEELGVADCLAFHRDELVRQRDLLQSVWSWYLLPFYPGMALIIIAGILRSPDALGFAALLIVMIFVTSLIVIRANAQAATMVQRLIDELDQDPANTASEATAARSLLQHWSVWATQSLPFALLGGLVFGRFVVPLIPMLDALSPLTVNLVVVLLLTLVGVALRAAWWLTRRKP